MNNFDLLRDILQPEEVKLLCQAAILKALQLNQTSPEDTIHADVIPELRRALAFAEPASPSQRLKQ
jgi:hypothetical protein